MAARALAAAFKLPEEDCGKMVGSDGGIVEGDVGVNHPERLRAFNEPPDFHRVSSANIRSTSSSEMARRRRVCAGRASWRRGHCVQPHGLVPHWAGDCRVASLLAMTGGGTDRWGH